MTVFKHETTGEKLSHRALQDRLGASFPRNSPPAGWEIVTPPEPTFDELKQRKRSEIVQARKEMERQGVTVNGVRYAGDSDNRRDMKEALDYCTQTGTVAFTAWKDADGRFHPNHPVSDVRNALMRIAMQRGQLIAQEGDLMARIDAAETEQDLADINW